MGSDILEPVILFNRMLMELREKYDRLECPIEKYCPFYDDECLGKYMYCPIYLICRNRSSVAKCIAEMYRSYLLHGIEMITWRDIPSLIDVFLKSSGVIP